MDIFIDDIIVQDEIRKTCECFDIDPFKAISEGTLLATVDPGKADAVVEALDNEGIKACIAGNVVPQSEGMHYHEQGEKKKLEHPKVDPFWIRFEEYLSKSASDRK